MMSSPDDAAQIGPDDAALLAAIARLWQQVDPPPVDLADGVLARIAAEDLEFDLLTLVESEDALAGVRSAADVSEAPTRRDRCLVAGVRRPGLPGLRPAHPDRGPHPARRLGGAGPAARPCGCAPRTRTPPCETATSTSSAGSSSPVPRRASPASPSSTSPAPRAAAGHTTLLDLRYPWSTHTVVRRPSDSPPRAVRALGPARALSCRRARCSTRSPAGCSTRAPRSPSRGSARAARCTSGRA